MKCQIQCLDCAAELESVCGDGTKYPGEHVEYVAGIVKTNCFCDDCGHLINASDLVICSTIWAEHSPNPYTPWEAGYIDPVGMYQHKRDKHDRLSDVEKAVILSAISEKDIFS